jgi:hypothetical protein
MFGVELTIGQFDAIVRHKNFEDRSMAPRS